MDGAVFWLALGFGLIWLLRLAPSGGGLLLVWMQLLVGLALLSLAVPLAWRLVHRHLLWSLRNKLILTYLLIGLAPVVLFLTLAAISAYIAAGQFSIHLADTRMHQQLDEIGVDNSARASRQARMMRDRAGQPDGPASAGPSWFSAKAAFRDERSCRQSHAICRARLCGPRPADRRRGRGPVGGPERNVG